MSGPPEADQRSGITAAARRVLIDAIEAYGDRPDVLEVLDGHLERLDEPLRVAIAGKVKSGKSTLLNAIVGEEIAPTDAGECTRVVTWYEHGARPRVTLHPVDGPARELPIHRSDGRLQLDLGGARPEEVEALSVEWPSRGLRSLSLIDTPGIDSLSASVSQRTVRFLTPEDEPSTADAIIYLLRHLHAGDVRFLESFRDTGVGRATMVNTIGVLSRADEVGAGRLDSLISAKAVAARYRQHPVVRQLCSTVIPLAGLLAQAGRTLRQSEYLSLQSIAQQPREVTNATLLSVDRFVAAQVPIDVTAEQRIALLDRLGIFGVRLALTFVRSGMHDPTLLADELVRRSGLDEVRRVLATQFAGRSELLKARSTLLGIERVLRDHPRRGADRIGEDVERIFAGAHEFQELALLSSLRSSQVTFAMFGPEEDEGAERLLGAAGTSPVQRLGVGSSVTDADAHTASLEAIRIWRSRAESPLIDRTTAHACHIVARSCEGMLADLALT